MKSKSILIGIIVMLSLALVVITCLFINKKCDNKIDTNNIKKFVSKKDQMPEFNIIVNGEYETNINDKLLKNKNVQVYEFEKEVHTSWGTFKDYYTGVKLFDALTAAGITSFESLSFIGMSGNSTFFAKSVLNEDSTYIIFYRNGEPINEYKTSFIDFNYDYAYSLEGITRITIYGPDSE